MFARGWQDRGCGGGHRYVFVADARGEARDGTPTGFKRKEDCCASC